MYDTYLHQPYTRAARPSQLAIAKEMIMKQFIVVGQDYGVAGPLADICDEIEKQGGTCWRFLREPLPDNFASLLADSLAQKATVVICGMSSFEDRAASELKAAGIAIVSGVPLILFADIEPTMGRPFFKEIRPHAKAFIVPNERTAATVRTAYPGAIIINEGNPDDEKNFRPKLTREASRQKFGVGDGTAMVVAPLGKDLRINRLHLGCTGNALEGLDRPFALFVSLHRDDPNNMAAYQDLFPESFPVTIGRAITEEVIPGADLVVASASGESKRASRLRIPVLNYFTEEALARLEKSTGSREWPEVIRGCEAEVRPPRGHAFPLREDLITMMGALLEGAVDLRPRQAEAYPTPKPGIAGRIAAELLALP